MCSILNKLMLHSFLTFLNNVLGFLNFLTDVVLVSYKPVSYFQILVNPSLSNGSKIQFAKTVLGLHFGCFDIRIKLSL